MSLISAMALGTDCIDDCDVLRRGQTRAVLGHAVAAPSTLGTFLRAFTFGHVRQLDRLLAETLSRAWAAGAGPGNERLVVDVENFVGEVCGYEKQGAGYGYTHARGYHPILATPSATGEVLHIRARKGSANTSRGALRFVEELIPRVQRAGASGPKLLRAASVLRIRRSPRACSRRGGPTRSAPASTNTSRPRSPGSASPTGSRWLTTQRPARRRSPRRCSALSG